MERLRRKLVFAEGGHASQLLRIMQDIAGDDADRRGSGMDTLLEKNCTWVLVKLRIDIKRMPQPGEELEISTWPGKSRLAIYPRCYEIRDAAGEVIVSGLSTWVIMDMDSRSLISGESRGITLAGEEEGRLHPQRKVSVPEGGSEFALTPSADQIDRNGHMNNAAYLDAVEPMLPEEYRGRELRAIAVDYEHEILPGRYAAVRTLAQGDSCFFEGSMEGRVCFRISETFAV